MKKNHVFIYAFALTLFMAGIIFSTMATYTEISPLSLTMIAIFMVIIFISYVFALLAYRKRTLKNQEENR